MQEEEVLYRAASIAKQLAALITRADILSGDRYFFISLRY
jgi:hypothetical protein